MNKTELLNTTVNKDYLNDKNTLEKYYYKKESTLAVIEYEKDSINRDAFYAYIPLFTAKKYFKKLNNAQKYLTKLGFQFVLKEAY